ncbi:hypothetical protein [Marinobacter salarius]|uniref:hypothetical protein n=1 Tax=Marinobacter salarius TaxID=1420917 RepID=UPI000C11B6BE|nr:hypothetical protein [Marinobacter salarius]MBJ7277708.1 hypothetical protein [Marinobacter salarius]PHQ75641.1 MAG: hypothetical protein COB82_01790 [Marinobacter sp.]
MSYLKSISVSIMALTFAAAVNSETVFVDSFESGDMSNTNAHGFDWGNNNRTSVVTADGVVYASGTKSIPTPSGRDWSTKDGLGDHHLRFYYKGGEPMTEQRFDLGRHYEDIWLAYWIRVPTNFKHGSLNNKFLSIWPQKYDRSGTVTWQTRPNGSGGANLVYQDGGVTSGEANSTPFITVPEDRGRWMHVVARVKAASGPDTRDGIIQFYRRWEDSASYQLIHEKTSSDTWDDESIEQGISQGYIMGWANDPYDVTTEWFLDGFSVHTSSPIQDFLANSSQKNRPNPPSLKVMD